LGTVASNEATTISLCKSQPKMHPKSSQSTGMDLFGAMETET